MEVEIVSTHCIKPSSPTPEDLRIHKLSFLDHFAPSAYPPIVFFYASDDHDALPHRLLLLKQSLSHTLTRFYPFAGTIFKHKPSIDCNDRGIPYSEAKANSTLFHFFNQPNLSSLLHKFHPVKPSPHESSKAEGEPVAMIQVTAFTCGGLAIGAVVSHMVTDGAAVSFFLKSWSAMARNASHYASPSFDAPLTISPQNDALPKNASIIAQLSPFLKTGKRATRRFVFGPTATAHLRAQASSPRVPNPTRVEAISALIWKSIITALKTNSILITHPVNMRRRAKLTFPEGYIGNFLWIALSSLRADEKENGTELSNLVIKLRESISKINSDFVKSLEGKGGSVKYGELLKEIEDKTQRILGHGGTFVGYTSWCRFGHYDVDFGWGKPKWVTHTGSTDANTTFFNSVFLIDTPSSYGIEAWIYLKDHDMAMLEQDKELLAFAALDPNPLDLNIRTLSHQSSSTKHGAS